MIKYFSTKRDRDYIIHGSCYDYIKNMPNNSVDCVLTSPPYNNARSGELKPGNMSYNSYIDFIPTDEYLGNITELFNDLDRVLNKNGVILFNFNYSSNDIRNSELVYLLVASIILNTNFTIADTIIWKKSNFWPNVMSRNKLSRCWEYVFVFCRRSEYNTFNCNKPISSKRITGQNNYCNIINFIEAKNNDGSNKLNHCTFSKDFCKKLLNLYTKEGDVVFDPFIGTGTTFYACLELNRHCIGVEIDREQVLYMIKKIRSDYGIH